MKTQTRTFLAILSVCATVVRADITTNLNSIADSSIHKFDADSNFGIEGTMAAGDTGSSGGNEVRRALLAFDLPETYPRELRLPRRSSR